MVELLLRHQADVGAKDEKGRMPWGWAWGGRQGWSLGAEVPRRWALPRTRTSRRCCARRRRLGVDFWTSWLAEAEAKEVADCGVLSATLLGPSFAREAKASWMLRRRASSAPRGTSSVRT